MHMIALSQHLGCRCWGDCVSTYQACGNPSSVAVKRCQLLADSLRVANPPPAGPVPCYALSRSPPPAAAGVALPLAAAAAALILAARR